MHKTHKFEIFAGRAGHYWRLIAKANKKIVADGSEGYATRSNTRRAVRRLQACGFGAGCEIVNV